MAYLPHIESIVVPRTEEDLGDSDELLKYNPEDPNFASFTQMMQMLANAAKENQEFVLPILKSCCSLWLRPPL